MSKRKITLETLKNDLDSYSTTVSSTVRTTALGVIAALWAVFTADGIVVQATTIMEIPTNLAVRSAFVFSSAALLCDVIQYVSSYWMTSIGYDRFENIIDENKQAEFLYDKTNLGTFGVILYQLGFYLFPFKLALAIFSAVSFVFVAFGIDIKL